MFSLLFTACRDDGPAPTPAEPLDLVGPLAAGQARAGVVTDERALWGGISAEGRAGDVKMFNDRVRFVIQGVRAGSWYVPEGGGVIDADVVRPEGELGRDAVEEWSVMYGLGRLMVPEAVEVVADGRDGEAAVVRVRGYEGPLGLLEGALETPGIVPDLHLEMETEYRLEPDSWLLEVTTTARATTVAAPITIADVLIGADEVTSPWVPGSGFGDPPSTPRPWTAYQGDLDDFALIIAAGPGEELSASGFEVIAELASMVVGAGPPLELQPGDSASWTRFYGVGPDLATLSAAALARQGADTQPVSGTVTAPDGPVAGARVVIDVDGAPYTVALTGADGSFATDVPAGAASVIASGRGTGRFLDLPVGSAAGSPYAASVVQEDGRAALVDGAVEVPQAVGRGIGAAGDPLTLGAPATLVVRCADGLPFTVRLGFPAGPPAIDEARFPGWPDGLAAAGWSRDGELELLVEPGSYDLVAHRGPRFELHQQAVTLAAGERTEVEVELPAAFDSDGYVLGDPHSHASPSDDGGLPMEDRLIVSAAVGLQVHFGTDHDHLADYRPLLAPLGLDGVLRSVVADEVSPPVRGHFNIYPVEPVIGEPDNGAWEWWTDIPESTEAMVDTLRARHGDGFVLQSNHPTDSGLASSAGWGPGSVSVGNRWTDRFEAVEVLNSGNHDDFVPFWFDMVGRGKVVTPVGVSDSHTHFGGHVGYSATWFDVGVPLAALTDDGLVDAIRAGRTVPTRGPLIVTDPPPGSTVAAGTALTIEVRTASWVKVDRVRLLRDGADDQVVTGTSGEFALSPAEDAWYVVVAEGDAPMAPVSGDLPWALAGPWRVDAGGDGWEPPLPPLVIQP